VSSTFTEMPTAWPDEEFIADQSSTEDWLDDDLLGNRPPARCTALFRWHDQLGRRAKWSTWERIADLPRTAPGSLPAPIYLWSHCDADPERSAGVRVVLAALGEALDELDAEPLPQREDRRHIAALLASYAERLVALRSRLPSGASEEFDSESEGHVVVDWKALNEAQLTGWTSPIRGVDGDRLASFRPSTHGSVIRESSDEEPIIE
jgi:hypothetical protein